MMKVLGITGGVGAGKSTVLNYLASKYRARVIQADQVGHLLMEPGQSCYYRIVELFGSGILRGDQTIDRSRLAALVYQDEERLRELNQIVHPAVKTYICDEIAKARLAARVPFVVIEAALLLEDRYDLVCDQIWYVHADREVRIERLRVSRGYSVEKSSGIIKNQLPEEVFRARCQVVIDNSGNIIENTYEEIDRRLKEHGFV